MKTRPGPAKFLLLAGVVELLFLALLGWWPGPGVPFPGLLLFAGALGAYAVAGGVGARSAGAASPVVAWGFAVAFRLALLPLTPELSDDIYRYLWDGHVQLQGINPYLHAPSDPALLEIRTPWHGQINHPDVSTIYPPLAQIAFLAVAAVGGLVIQAKVLWVGLDLLTGWVLARVARATGRDDRLVLVLYLWCPLLVVETAWNGHLEPLGLLGLALLLALARKPGAAGAAGAGAALTKLAPVAALPPLVRRLGIRFLLGFGAVTLLLYLPYLPAGSALWDGLTTYVRDWRFMVGPFSLLEAALSGRWPPRLAAGAVVAGVIAWTTMERFEPERALFWILGAGLLVSPTVHPWYLLWILPFAALRRSVPWLLLCGLVFLGYWGLAPYQETGRWSQPLWLRLAIWAPPLLLLVRQLVVRGPAALRGDPAA